MESWHWSRGKGTEDTIGEHIQRELDDRWVKLSCKTKPEGAGGP